MANDTERLINHADGLAIVKSLDSVKDALLATSGSSSGAFTMDAILANIKNGAGPTNFPVGTEMVFKETPSLSTIIAGNMTEGTNASITGQACNVETFVAKIGKTSGIDSYFYYYNSAWHKDSITGDVVTMSQYGITYSGTPASGDFIFVAFVASAFTMQVADHDCYTLKNSNLNHHLVLAAKDCVRGAQQFSNNPELAFANTKAIIPAGKYKITTKTAGDDDCVVDGTYVFTTTQAIPLGGGFHVDVIGNLYGDSQKTRVPTTVKTYAADHSTVLETLTLTAYNSSTDTDAVDMGTYTREYDSTVSYVNTYGYVNFSRRVAYGSGDYATSIYRQWLNAETAKATWWKIKSIFKLKPANGWTDQVNGYLYQMDTDLMKGLQTTKVKYYMADSDYNLMTALSLTKPVQYLDDPDVSVSGHIVTVNCKMFPMSVVEVGLGNQYNDNLANTHVLKLYSGSTAADRIKYYSGAAKYWWLRSTSPWGCSHAALVAPTGTLNTTSANIARGVVPACTIG